MFKTSIGSMSATRRMPNRGVGLVDTKIVNPYTNITTNKIGTSSGNDTTISKAMRYSQYVNNPNRNGVKNVQTYSYTDYVAKYGPMSSIDRSCYSNPMFKPQVLVSNNKPIPIEQQFMFHTNYR